MPKHLVIVGAGHAHMTILKRLKEIAGRGHRVTVINPGPYHYYSGMGPGMVSGIYAPEAIRFHVEQMTRTGGGMFLEDTVVRIDRAGRRLLLKSGGEIGYDVVSFNTGSRVPFEIPAAFQNEFVFPVKPIQGLVKARKKLMEALKTGPITICIAGGGPAGVEISANLKALTAKVGGEARIILLAGNRLLSGMENRMRRHALGNLNRRGVTVREGVRLDAIGEKEAILSDGSRLRCDFIFPAIGVSPAPLFRDSGLAVGEDLGLRVNRLLQSVSNPEIFGGGDCISFAPHPIERVGVHAVRENPVLFHNLSAALEDGQDFRPFHPQKSFLLILNMGDGSGIARWKLLAWKGRSAFLLKDYIDRKFMRRFQISGEQAFPARSHSG